MSSFPTSGSGTHPKVAIPKLPLKQNESPRKNSTTRLNRVSRACLNCRARKIKCNGAKPSCANCGETASSCVYASSRKDRLKTATGQNRQMIQLLQDLRGQLSDGAQNRVDDLLASVVEDVADAAGSLQKLPDKHGEADTEHEEEQGEADMSAEVGSADSAMLDGDLMRDEQTRAAGSIGKASEIKLSRNIHSHGAYEDKGPYGPPGQNSEVVTERSKAPRRRQASTTPPTLMHTKSTSFFLDDEHLEMILEVDPLELPPFADAERLLQMYMESCHNSFPFLGKKSFVHHFYHYYAAQARGQPYNLSQSWRAQLNAVFAIGAVYSHLTLAEWRGDERDHLVYHSRAWALSLKDSLWLSLPDLPQMQITGLLSFYCLSIGHINRSWILSSMAIRFGCALGLHLRNRDPNAGVAKKEVLSRIWWSHCALDRVLAVMTGRPRIALRETCSVPLPLPVSSEDIEERIIESRYGDQMSVTAYPLASRAPDSAAGLLEPPYQSTSDASIANLDPTNSGSYLRNIIQLGEVTHNALSLYTASASGQSWQDVQETIFRLTEDLHAWATSLPDGFNFFNYGAFTSHPYQRERNALNLLYHGTLILITRPCLCRLDRHIQNQTARSSEFIQRSALTCVEAAKAVARLLPDDPESNIVRLYETTPWWTMVHTIMQSLIVLLLEISYEPIQLPHDRREIMDSLKKLVRCLRVMGANNRMARRAYLLVMNMLRVLVTTIKMDIADLLHEDSLFTAPNEAQAPVRRQSQEVSPPLSAVSQSTHSFPSTRLPVHAAQLQRSYAHNLGDARQAPATDPTLSTQPHQARDNSPGAYPDLSTDSWSMSDTSLPGLFHTNFDEQNPLPRFGPDDYVMSGSEDPIQRAAT